MANGSTEAAAIKAAEAQIPNWRKAAKELREATGAPKKAPWWSGFGADARFGLRLLARQPMFSATVVLTLAVGLGACVAIYSLLEAVVLRSLPFREPGRLVFLWEANKVRGFKDNVVAPANFIDWRARTKLFESMTAFTSTKRTFTGTSEPVELNVQIATPNHLSVLGIRPILGRDFRPEENRADAPVVLLSYAAWQRYFSGRPDIVGQKITLSGNPYEVIGVLPSDYPVSGLAVDLLTVLYLNPATNYRQASGRFLLSVGRLKPGVSIEQGRSELQGIAAQLEQEYVDFNKNLGCQPRPYRRPILETCPHRALDPDVCHGTGAADRLCQRREPVARPRRLARTRNRHSLLRRRQRIACRQTAVRRESCACHGWWHGGSPSPMRSSER